MATIGEQILALLAEQRQKDPKTGSISWLSRQTGIPRTNLDESINEKRLWRIGEISKIERVLGKLDKD